MYKRYKTWGVLDIKKRVETTPNYISHTPPYPPEWQDASDALPWASSDESIFVTLLTY